MPITMMFEFVSIAVAVAVLVLLYLLRRLVTPPEKIAPDNKAVLVTGCDTGFGHELALHLHQLGFVVFAGCLDSQGEGALHLSGAGARDNRLHTLQMDVGSDQEVWKASETVSSLLPPSTDLWAVVNNAGISTFGETEFCGMNVYQRLANINLWGPVRVCKAFLPLLRKSKGRIVNVTSILGRQASPGRSCYVASKHGLEGFSQCLRYEMRRWGVSVAIMEPGNFIAATGIFTGAKIDRMAEEMWAHAPAEVKQAYGEDFFRSRVQRMRYFARIGTTDKEPVIRAMVASVMDKVPRIRYTPNTFYWGLRTFVMTILPHPVGDYLYHSE